LLQNPAVRSFAQHMEICKANIELDVLQEIMPERTGEYLIEEELTAEQLQRIEGIYQYDFRPEYRADDPSFIVDVGSNISDLYTM